MSSGTLYLCATPIGNREDITGRVLKTLQEVDLIAAEDTRHSRGLLEYYGIQKSLISYHEHNKYERAEELLELLETGKNVALISDAGTPVISDPGEVLVEMARRRGIRVTSLPGPCALITGLTLSGLSARRFVFEGFLPQETKKCNKILEELQQESRTIILYEAPHRLRKTLQLLREALGGQRILCLCRELTKIHEESLVLTLEEAMEYYAEREPRGEYVLVLSGKSEEERARGLKEAWQAKTPQEHLEGYLSRGLSRKEAIRLMSEEFEMSRNELYALFMK